MTAKRDIRLLEDARLDHERECVLVSALVSADIGEARRVPCAITLEALYGLVDTPSRPDPLRLLRDFEADVAAAIARKLAGHPAEVAVTGRDLRGRRG